MRAADVRPGVRIVAISGPHKGQASEVLKVGTRSVELRVLTGKTRKGRGRPKRGQRETVRLSLEVVCATHEEA